MIKANKEIVIALLGLSGSGKTTFYGKLNSEAKIKSSPTPTYNHGVFKFSDTKISLFDCGGSSDAQLNCWDNCLLQAEGLIWMVDLSDEDELSTSVEALQKVVAKLDGQIPVLVLGNKTDLPNSVTPIEFDQAFANFDAQTYTISAATGKYTKEGFKLIVDQVKEKRKQKEVAEVALQQQMTAQKFRAKHDKDD
jgi:small GTP-binding protein